MYSLVLMVAMSTNAEAPGFGSHYGSDFWLKHCFFEDCYPARYGWTCGPGRGGYYPTGYTSCYGGCGGCGGCYSWSGCCGYSSCHGCYSSCSGCGGCWSSCHGCLGYVWTTGTGCGGVSLYGCYGSLPMMPGIGYAGFSGTGNFGMYGLNHAPINPNPVDPLGLSYPPANYYGNPRPANPNYGTPGLGDPFTTPPNSAPPIPTNPILDSPSPITPSSAPGTVVPPVESLPINARPVDKVVPIVPESSSRTTSRALRNDPVAAVALESPNALSGSIIIHLPNSAKLFVDDMRIANGDSATRHFHTPALERGAVYYYMVKIEQMKDGKPVSEERKIRVRAGETTTVSFDHNKQDKSLSIADVK